MNTETEGIDIEKLYSKLRSAVALESDSNCALIRARTIYEPAGGKGSKVNPPTYPAGTGKRGEWTYIIEKRIVDGQECPDVLLDSVASQANRAELALLKGVREGKVTLPLIEIRYTSPDGNDPIPTLTMTSLELSHRYADAYLRDSKPDSSDENQSDKKTFDETELGKMFRKASSDDATALYQHDPGSLVFGAWNSHRPGYQVKFPRIYASEIIGWNPEVGKRKAGRMDPLNLVGEVNHLDNGDWEFATPSEKTKGTKKTEGKKLSEIGHGNIMPNDVPGGVTVTSVERLATISFAALNRLSFGIRSPEETVAARTVLAAYALLADRLAFSGPSLWLRSGCELVVTEDNLEWVQRGGGAEKLVLNTERAIDLYEYAVEQAGEFTPLCELQSFVFKDEITKAIQFALTKTESSEANDAGNTTDA